MEESDTHYEAKNSSLSTSLLFVELLVCGIFCYLAVLLTGNIFKIFRGFNRKHFLYLSLFMGIEIFIMTLLDYDMRKFFEQVGLIVTTAIGYRAYFIYVLKRDISLFVKCYLNMSVVMVGYALVAYALNITISGRLEGWGGDIALLILPALVFYFFHKEFSIRCALTVLAFVLASSTASFAALFIILALFLFVYNRKNFFKLIVVALVVFVVSSAVSSYLSDNKSDNNDAALKFKETWEMLQNNRFSFYDLETLNASTYAFLTNLCVAEQAPSRLFGTGLGTHPINYEKIYPSRSTTYRLYGLNANDAYSLSIRVFSELGILGLFLLFVFMYKNFNSLSLFSFMAMSYLINACITGGHYTANGGMLFFVFFYFAGKYVQQDAYLGDEKKRKGKNMSIKTIVEQNR